MLHLTLLSFSNLNSIMRQGQAGDAVQLDARFFIIPHGSDEVRLCLRVVSLRLQHSIVGRSTQSVFLLLYIKGVAGQIATLSRCFNLGTVLRQYELGVADFDPDLVLELLQAKFG